MVSLCGREVALGAYLGDPEMERSASNQIRVRSDDGTEHTVLELTRVSPTLKGARRWILEDGRPVECINDDTFQIVQTGEILKKV